MYTSKEVDDLGYVPILRTEFLGSRRQFEGLKRIGQEPTSHIYDLWLGSWCCLISIITFPGCHQKVILLRKRGFPCRYSSSKEGLCYVFRTRIKALVTTRKRFDLYFISTSKSLRNWTLEYESVFIWCTASITLCIRTSLIVNSTTSASSPYVSTGVSSLLMITADILLRNLQGIHCTKLNSHFLNSRLFLLAARWYRHRMQCSSSQGLSVTWPLGFLPYSWKETLNRHDVWSERQRLFDSAGLIMTNLLQYHIVHKTCMHSFLVASRSLRYRHPVP